MENTLFERNERYISSQVPPVVADPPPPRKGLVFYSCYLIKLVKARTSEVLEERNHKFKKGEKIVIFSVEQTPNL